MHPFCQGCYIVHFNPRRESACCGEMRVADCLRTEEEVAAVPGLQLGIEAGAQNGMHPFCHECYCVHFKPRQEVACCRDMRLANCLRAEEEVCGGARVAAAHGGGGT